MNQDWIDKKESFTEIDVRGLQGNFLPGVLKKAKSLKVGEGFKVIQSFEPIPLYSTLEKMGYEYSTEKEDKGKYVVCFYRVEEKEGDLSDLPLKPIVLTKYAEVDAELADITVNFWKLTWDKENPAIDLKTKLLLSLANAVGAKRYRQATRELIKAYHLGATTEEIAELLSLIAWNQGMGYFSSEIAPSPLFKVYQMIKTSEEKGLKRKEINEKLLEQFGEKNPDTGFNPAK